MRRMNLVLGTAIVMGFLAAPAIQAGPYADDLSKCLVKSATDKDKTDLVRWVFAATALHPDVSSLVAVSDKQRTAMTRSVGALFERLLTKDCRPQYRDAMNYEGEQTLIVSFGVLGEVAMKGLMEHPAVNQGIAELDDFVSKDELMAAIKPEP